MVVRTPAPIFSRSRLATHLLCSTAILLLPDIVQANPTGGQVAAGAATISQPSAASTIVTQQTEKAIINWQSFSVGAGETTNFNQPDAKAITLNRVTGVDPSKIVGNLTANGQVWLVNPNGIAFGASARVDVAGLLATTIDIADRDFMSGNYRFMSLKNPGAMVTNAGRITVRDAGLAALVAPGVSNSGIIEANLGQIQLSSAAAFTVDLYGDGLFNIALDKQVTQAIKRENGTAPDAAVSNSGGLIASGGKILLTANAVKSVVDHAIDMTGYIQATSANVAQNGDIILDGGTEGTVAVAGTLDASGTGSGQTGGTVAVTGHDVQLASTAKIDASGDADGGTVHIGGDEHGAGPLRNASVTSVALGATIDADAISKGNGGTVVVWSDDQTDFRGTISARGGAANGNGGAAEVSSHGMLAYNGETDLSAPFGSAGTLLLDPRNVTIGSSGVWIITPTALVTALSNGNVLVTTSGIGTDQGNITIATNFTWNGSNSLTLSANHNIVFDPGAMLANIGSGNLILRADSAGVGTGTVLFSAVGIDWSGSTGTISLLYDPTDYANPTDFSGLVSGVTSQFTAYMLVNNASGLQNIQNNLSGTYALGSDIDAGSIANFIPIGDGSSPFVGTLDGFGHTIDHLTTNTTTQYVGLIGYLGSTGIVRNLGVTNVNITSVYNAVGSFAHVGPVVGFNQGLVSHDFATGTVTASSDQTAPNVGGLVGTSFGTITQSFALTNITDTGTGFEPWVGGLLGQNAGIVSQSYAQGRVSSSSAIGNVGGLVGYNSGGTITQSYSTGQPTGAGNVGGLVGLTNGSGSVTNSYWDIQTSGTATSSGGTGQTTAQLKGALPTGFESAVWTVAASDYPDLRWHSAPLISFTTLEPTQSSLLLSFDSQNANPFASITYRPISFAPVAVFSPADARAQVFRVLQDAGLDTGNTVLTNILMNFLSHIPQQYLSQASIDQALGDAIRAKLEHSSLVSFSGDDAAGLVISVWIDILGDELSKKYPPIAVEEIKYGLDLAANVALADAKYGADPELAILIADTQTTVGELISTSVAGAQLHSQYKSNIAQADQMDILSAQYREQAAHTSDQHRKALLLQTADQEAQAAAYLRTNASGYSTNSVSSFLNSVWNSLF